MGGRCRYQRAASEALERFSKPQFGHTRAGFAYQIPIGHAREMRQPSPLPSSNPSTPLSRLGPPVGPPPHPDAPEAGACLSGLAARGARPCA